MAATEPAKNIEPFWEEVTSGSLAQGDFLPGCFVPLVSSDFDKAQGKDTPVKVRVDVLDLIVMTQSCDLENNKAPLVACCPIHSILRFEEFTPKLKQKGEWERVRQGRIEGLHLLGSTRKPEDKWGAYVVDFRSIYSLPAAYMTAHAQSLGKHWRLRSPYLEHFSQAFARFFMRVGLPSGIPSYNDPPTRPPPPPSAQTVAIQ
jgi:hypothetical protein